MWRIVQHETPDDFVLATGAAHSVREFVEAAFACSGIGLKSRGAGVDEIGYDQATGRELAAIDPRYFRPTEVDFLLGDPSKARETLGWSHATSFESLVEDMVTADRHARQQSPAGGSRRIAPRTAGATTASTWQLPPSTNWGGRCGDREPILSG